jgi:amino-acid N-acetyltransferase
LERLKNLFEYRHATFADIEAIFTLINDFAAEGLMLQRSYSALYEILPELVVAVEIETGKVVGCGALHCVWMELSEIRSLAVHKDFHRNGIGGKLVKLLIENGKKLGVKKFFTLTYNTPFFASVGFKIVEKATLPQKIWQDCISCPQFPNCNEIAMTLEI